MCGIHGFNFDSEELVRKMMRESAHRGPDDEGHWVAEGISLGHNRLSIIDLSEKGRNPFWDVVHTCAVVFNGEIYNFKSLREELIGKGYAFASQTDTEVIVNGYKEWGRDVVKRLNGIFAFALWDSQKKELFLARDPLGVKPLYYYHKDSTFIFSSEIKSILTHAIPRTLNKEGLNLYLATSYVPGPLTLFENIYKLLPAHYLIVREGVVEIKKYWEADGEPVVDGPQKNIERTLKETIVSAVHRQLISDRPLGLYLSGGIDSSIVLWAMKQGREDINTFSVGFDVTKEEEEEKFNADFHLARRTAKYFGTHHHEVLVSSRDVIESLEDIVWHMDEPISNPTAVAMYKLAQFTKNKADVVLGGEGGDELFGGYPYYSLNKAADYFHNLPKSLRFQLGKVSPRLSKLNTPSGLRRYALFLLRNKVEVEEYVRKGTFDYEKALAFFDERFFVGEEENVSSADALMNVHRKSWLVDHSLMLTDKMSMASAVEVRVPLLDKDVVEYAVRIPARYKASVRQTKIILKDAFKNELPPYLFTQPKRGWFSPGAKWLRHDSMLTFAQEVLTAEYCSETACLFEWEVLQRMLESHRKKKGYYRIPLWAVLTFQLWAKRYHVTV